MPDHTASLGAIAQWLQQADDELLYTPDVGSTSPFRVALTPSEGLVSPGAISLPQLEYEVVDVPRAQRVFAHRAGLLARADVAGTSELIEETQGLLCQTFYPYRQCPCGAMRVQWDEAHA